MPNIHLRNNLLPCSQSFASSELMSKKELSISFQKAIFFLQNFGDVYAIPVKKENPKLF